MTTVTPAAQTVTMLDIYVGDNVRDRLDDADVDRLAGSIALQGLIQPVAITAAGELAQERGFRWELVAGFTRYAAVCKLGWREIAVTIRESDQDGERQAAAIAAARAAENIARTQLNPHEEAVAVQAMLDSGLSPDGVAQALGWSKARVSARVKLLELPERAQRMIGDGTLALAAIEPLRAIGAVDAAILDVLVDHLARGGWGAESFVREPGRVLAEAIRTAEVFGASLDSTDGREIESLKLGKRAQADYDVVVELEKKLGNYGYARPRVPFTEEDLDQARAAGVLIELPGAKPLVVDRGVYRELARQAIRRHIPHLEAQIVEAAVEAAAARRGAGDGGTGLVDPDQQARRDHGRQMRQLAEQAHNVNTDLGWSLRNGLSVVDPGDLDVARFFVYSLFAGDAEDGYGSYGDRARDLAIRGVRLVIEEFRTDVTKTRKDGTRGALRIDYGNPQDSNATREWMWKYLQAARTAGDLYGRALVIIAAERYAVRLVVPASQQHPPLRWPSRKGYAEKALAKLAGPHLPATLKQLEKAIAKAKSDHDETLRAIRESPSSAAAAAAGAGDTAADRPVDVERPDGEADDADVDGEAEGV